MVVDKRAGNHLARPRKTAAPGLWNRLRFSIIMSVASFFSIPVLLSQNTGVFAFDWRMGAQAVRVRMHGASTRAGGRTRGSSRSCGSPGGSARMCA